MRQKCAAMRQQCATVISIRPVVSHLTRLEVIPMTDVVHDPLVTAIPRPRIIRQRIAELRQEREVLSRLLRVSEFAAERLDAPADNRRGESEVSHAN